MPAQAGSTLTSAQECRKACGLPYEGPQPEVVFMQVSSYDSTGVFRRDPGLDRYYMIDDRTPLNAVSAANACMTHAVNLVHNSPVQYEVRIRSLYPITASGESVSGRGVVGTDLTLNQSNIEYFLPTANTASAQALARAHPGESLARACVPRGPRSAFADVDISSITRQVALGSRDATGTKWNPDRIAALALLCRPAPSA